MTWLSSDTLVLLTRNLEQLKIISQHSGTPYTDQKNLEKELSLIKASRGVECALTMWEDKPDNDKIWSNFKTHFHDAQL